jgi:hypothetical protein
MVLLDSGAPDHDVQDPRRPSQRAAGDGIVSRSQGDPALKVQETAGGKFDTR